MTPPIFQREDGYLYCLKGDEVDCFTRRTTDGRQAFLVILFPFVNAIFFDTEGRLLKVEEIPLSKPDGHYLYSDADESRVNSWMDSLGYRNGAIRVRFFFLQKYHIGITDFPAFFCSILREPAAFTEDEQIVARRELDRWKSEGLFVLYLNEHVDRWINREGDVEST